MLVNEDVMDEHGLRLVVLTGRKPRRVGGRLTLQMIGIFVFPPIFSKTRSRLPASENSGGYEQMPNPALSQKLKPSKKLAAILGSPEPISRPEAVKRLWDYFKKNNLQNPKNRREILADERLKPLFGKDKISMFEVGGIVNSNLERGSQTRASRKRAA
jgi:upstream activation factor subunit UAF30